MQKKQLYVSLEIAEDELRLLVAEYHMSRFNILRCDVQKCDGISNRIIQKPQLVTATILKMVRLAEENLSIKIKSLILVIPGMDAKCIRRRVNIKTEEGSHKILLSNIRKGLEKVCEYDFDDSYTLVNIGSVKYNVGGIVSRKMPIDERAEKFGMDVDLLYANKEVVYSYVKCVEKAGLNILNLCLDSYAVAEESAAIENSVNKYIILLDLSRFTTTLSLYYKGSLAGIDTQRIGYESWANALRRRYHLSNNECIELVENNCFVENGLYDDNVSYMWLDRDEHKQLTKNDIYNAVYDEVKVWISLINQACAPIKENGECKIIVTGKGADIVGVSSLTKLFDADCSVYIPATIGARKSAMCACLGAMYTTKKWLYIKNSDETSVETVLLSPREREKEDHNAFTKKLKNILMNK